MRTLAILGASGHGKVCADAALVSGWEKIVFFDDAWPNLKQVNRWDVVGDTQRLLEQACDFDGVVLAIGDNAIRSRKAYELDAVDAPFVVIKHPAAIVSPNAMIREGAVVLAGAVINIDAQIGRHCIVNTGAIIEHDCHLGSMVHISPGVNLAGGVSVGDLSWLGIGTSVRQCIKIGSRVVVGAGSVVIRDIPDDCTVMGVPAEIKIIREG